jgi:hypothetical protein
MKRKEKKKQKSKRQKKQRKIKQIYFLLQRTGLENRHLESPANVSTMTFSPGICTTSFQMTFIY